MTKGIIYYTDFHLDPEIHRICLNNLKEAIKGEVTEVVSVSLNQPLDFGKNIVLSGERSNTMYVKQIVTALENLTTDIVFFTEHDVLYDPSHFEFTATKLNTFYYDLNVWRWDYPQDRIITYKELTSLSMMSCNRNLALRHYRDRLRKIIESGWDKEDGIGKMQPMWIRMIGYEPGTKRRRIGGFSNDVSERWRSVRPNVDIRHNKTLSNPKTRLENFKHPPTDWNEKKLIYIENFQIKEMFNIK